MKASSHAIVVFIAMVLVGAASSLRNPRTSAAAPSLATGVEFQSELDHTSHATFGLDYPLTYTFLLPSGLNGLTAQYRYQLTDAWVSLPTITTSSQFNGVPAARFDSVTNAAYLSVAFSLSVDTVFLRVIDSQGREVSMTYEGAPLYYDNRHAAVVVSLDDFADWSLSSFQATIPLLVSKGINHTIAVETAMTSTASWAQLQAWVNEGATEAASHARGTPCSDSDYASNGGYNFQIGGSRDDILNNLTLPEPFVPTFIEPCGFESSSVRRAVVDAHYLDDRGTDLGVSSYAPWSTDGAYARIGATYNTDSWPNGGGSATLLSQANSAFDGAYASGGIYHLYDHPWKNLWSPGSFMDQHAQYISGRADVWYTAFGNLYQYHYLQERGKISVSSVTVLTATPIPTSSPFATRTPTPTSIGTPISTPTPTTSATVVSAYRSLILSNGPVGYWRLGEASGTVARDETGGHAGTFVNNPILSQLGALVGDPNTSVTFNGTTQYVNVPYSAALNTATFSVEVWAKVTGGGGTYRGVMASRMFPNGWAVYAAADNTWQFWVNSGTGMLVVSGGPVTLNSWTYLAGTFDGTTARLYVNGMLAGSGGSTAYHPQTSNALTIGQSEPGDGFYFPGSLDEAAEYGAALSAIQVQNDYLLGSRGPGVTPTPERFIIWIPLVRN